jgi:hypothetical protein
MGHQMSFSPDTSGSYVNCVDIGVTRYVQKANFSANGLPGNGFIDSSLTNGVPGGADRCNSSDITAVNCFGSWRATLCSQNANGKSYIPSGDGTCTPVAAVCKINSFTCTGTNPDLAWSTSNCTGITINNSVGSVPAVGSYSPAAFGTVYTMSTAEGVSAQSNPCPAAPTAALDSVWQENNAKTITKTVTPGSSVTVPLNFSNTGQSGSTVKNTQCNINSVNGIPNSSVPPANCDNTTLIAP